jgi:ribosome biogenesis protein SSF1/2
MYPYTAINLKESKMNAIKDYLSIVDVYGLSHMMMVTNTDKNSYIRFSRMPRGPTVTLKISEYVLAADIFAQNSELFKDKPHKYSPKPLTKSFNHVPLVIMNGFNSTKISAEYAEPVKITAMLLQSFFPPINLNEIQLKKCKRVVLFNLAFEETEKGIIPVIEFRHFDVDVEKHSMKKTISNIINNKKTDLSKFDNIADYILKQSGYTDNSDNEDPTLGICEVIGDEEMKSEKKKNDSNENIKVKLHEIGPRFNLKIQKIEEGFLKGNVTFHSYMKKTKKDIREMMEKIKVKKKLKKERKQVQEANVQKKLDDRPEEEKEREAECKYIYDYKI